MEEDSIMHHTEMEEGSSFHDNSSDGDEMQDDEEAPGVCVGQQISCEEYERQKINFTKTELERLLTSPAYQRRLKTCGTCWSPWLEGACRSDCMECGSFALLRPCPVCNNKCGAVWTRDIEMSHSNHEAHWVGECKLPWSEQKMYLQVLLTEPDEETLLEGMDDLAT